MNLRVFQYTSRFWSKEEFCLVEKDHIRDYLNKLDIHKSMGADGMHPQALRVMWPMAIVIARPLSIIFQRSWQAGQVTEDYKKANDSPVFKKDKKQDPGKHRLETLTFIPENVVGQILIDTISKY